MQNLRKKLAEAGHFDRDTQVSLMQYAAKMKRLKVPERRLESFISKAINRIWNTRGHKKSEEQVLAQVIPLVRKK